MKLSVLIFCLFFISNTSFGQSKLFLNAKMEVVQKKRDASYFRMYIEHKKDSSVTFKDYFIEDSKLHIEGRFKDFTQKIFDGDFIFYNRGVKFSEGRIKSNSFEGKWLYYYSDGKIKEERMFIDGDDSGVTIEYDIYGHEFFSGQIINNKLDGFCTEYYCWNGEKKKEGNFTKGIPNGEFKFYESDGVLKFQTNYSDGKRVAIWKEFDKDGKVICEKNYNVDSSNTQDDTCFQFLSPYIIINSESPSFIGGYWALYKYLRNNLDYPREERGNQIEGTVVVEFIVTKTGQIINVDAISAPNKNFAKAAIKVVKQMPKWEPGTIKGNYVDCYVTLPINFEL